MPRIELIPPSRADGDLARAYAEVRAAGGVRGGVPLAPRIMQCFSHRPALLRAAAEGYQFAGWGGTLPRTTRELVALLVARENDCFY